MSKPSAVQQFMRLYDLRMQRLEKQIKEQQAKVQQANQVLAEHKAQLSKLALEWEVFASRANRRSGQMHVETVIAEKMYSRSMTEKLYAQARNVSGATFKVHKERRVKRSLVDQHRAIQDKKTKVKNQFNPSFSI